DTARSHVGAGEPELTTEDLIISVISSLATIRTSWIPMATARRCVATTSCCGVSAGLDATEPYHSRRELLRAGCGVAGRLGMGEFVVPFWGGSRLGTSTETRAAEAPRPRHPDVRIAQYASAELSARLA